MKRSPTASLAAWSVASFALMLAGCSSLPTIATPTPTRSPGEIVTGIRALFPEFERLKLTRMQSADGCEYLAYARGAFATAPDTFACSFDADGPIHREPFDEPARTDLDALYRRSEEVGGRIQSAFPDYDAAGHVRAGSFGFRPCEDYVFEPGHEPLGTADSVILTEIDADWYIVTCEATGR